MIDRLLRQEALITNRTQTGAEDEYGEPTWEEAEPIATRCHVQPLSSEELAHRVGSRSTHGGWFFPDTPIGVHARVVLATGQGWEVEGPPRRWTNPRTLRDSHLEVDLVEVE